MGTGKTNINLSWSGGKDSALALYYLQKDPNYEVVGLHTTFGEDTGRVGMHGIHQTLIEAQAASIGLPLDKIYYPASGDNRVYEKAMGDYLQILEKRGVKHLAYGDILLEDLKKYREEKLAEKCFTGIFPLWKRDTWEVSEEIINLGFKTKICAADEIIGTPWVGQDYSHEFIKNLPLGVDPCGENGEFHSFCYQGPIFTYALDVSCRDVVQKSYELKNVKGEIETKNFLFADLLIK
jgi:uncharacterized protein (TIGR00290 family)